MDGGAGGTGTGGAAAGAGGTGGTRGYGMILLLVLVLVRCRTRRGIHLLCGSIMVMLGGWWIEVLNSISSKLGRGQSQNVLKKRNSSSSVHPPPSPLHRMAFQIRYQRWPVIFTR